VRMPFELVTSLILGIVAHSEIVRYCYVALTAFFCINRVNVSVNANKQ